MRTRPLFANPVTNVTVTKPWSGQFWSIHQLSGILSSSYLSQHKQTRIYSKISCRFCYNTYYRFSSVSAMQNCLSLSTVQSRINKAKLSMMYKIIYHLLAIPDNCFSPIYSPLWRGYYSQLATRIDSYKFLVFPLAIKLWNSLPPFVVNSPIMIN